MYFWSRNCSGVLLGVSYKIDSTFENLFLLRSTSCTSCWSFGNFVIILSCDYERALAPSDFPCIYTRKHESHIFHLNLFGGKMLTLWVAHIPPFNFICETRVKHQTLGFMSFLMVFPKLEIFEHFKALYWFFKFTVVKSLSCHLCFSVRFSTVSPLIGIRSLLFSFRLPCLTFDWLANL